MPVNAFFLEYDTAQYPFRRILETEVFRVRPLEQLHTFWARQKQRADAAYRLAYADNLGLRKLMQQQPDESPFYQVYRSFVRNEIAVHYGNKLSYSAHPKMRVHLAGTPSVSSWHRDADITLRPEQMNVFLPFTDCSGTNALWCESTYGANDFQPVPLRYGQALIFDGGYLSHGSVDNTSNATRVSLDFRFSGEQQAQASPWGNVLSARPDTLGSGHVCAVRVSPLSP